MKFVEGAQGFRRTAAPTRSRKRWTTSARPPTSSTKPFIYLSAGVSNPEFTEALELAAEAGTRFSGVLCGRATWKDGIAVYGKQGGTAFRKWLEDEGVKNIQNVNAAAEGGSPVVRILWRPVGRGIGVDSFREPAAAAAPKGILFATGASWLSASARTGPAMHVVSNAMITIMVYIGAERFRGRSRC